MGGFVCGLSPILAHTSYVFVPSRRTPHTLCRQPELRRQWVVSYVVLSPTWRTPHTLSCPLGSPNYAASGWFRVWFVAHPGAPHHTFSCSIGSPNYAASGWFRTWFCAHPGAPLTRLRTRVLGRLPSRLCPLFLRSTQQTLLLAPLLRFTRLAIPTAAYAWALRQDIFFAKPVCGLEGMWGAQTLELLKGSATS